jgi:hypothetical protein
VQSRRTEHRSPLASEQQDPSKVQSRRTEHRSPLRAPPLRRLVGVAHWLGTLFYAS